MDRTPRPVSVLLTVLAAAAAEAELVGHAQVVDTGEVVAVRSLAELGQLLRRLTDIEGGTP